MNRIVMISAVIILTLSGLAAIDRCPAEDPPVQILLTDPPTEIPAELLSEFLIENSGADAARITAAMGRKVAVTDRLPLRFGCPQRI